MRQFAANPVHFAVDCALEGGQCRVESENVLFLDDGREHSALAHLQAKCGRVVIIPDAADEERALLYHTSCRRMADVVGQIFDGCLLPAARLPQRHSEVTIGELHRRSVARSYEECKRSVAGFGFWLAPPA